MSRLVRQAAAVTVAAALLAAALLLAACDTTPGPLPVDQQVVGVDPTVPPLHPDVDDLPVATVTIVDGSGRPVGVAVRVADTPTSRQQGLMHVADLPDGYGMLFVFPEEVHGGFWMKNTLVPLDIAFIDGDGQIVDILAMEPCEADPCPTYTPAHAYESALEVPQGWFAASGVSVGDQVRWDSSVADPR